MTRFRRSLTVVLALCALQTAALAQEDGDPSTLFLTWFGDPTSSIAIQWLEPAEPLPVAEESAPPDLPQMGKVTIDGTDEDWAGRGLCISFLTDPDGAVPDAADFHAQFRAGWEEDALVLAFRVTDDQSVSAPDATNLAEGDGVELEITNPLDPSTRYRILLALPAAKEIETRQQWSSNSGRTLRAEARVVTVEKGYAGEVRLPWSNLGVVPSEGAHIEIQAVFRDLDPGESPRLLTWFPGGAGHGILLRLAAPGTAPFGLAPRRLPGRDPLRLAISAPPEAGGKIVTVMAGKREIGFGRLEPRRNKCEAILKIAPPPKGRSHGNVTIRCNDKELGAYRFDASLWLSDPPPQTVSLWAEKGGPEQKTEALATPFGESSHVVRRAVFENLTPGSIHAFRIGEGPAVHRFRTAPATLSEPLIFAEGGDIGTSATVAQLHGHASSWDPLFGLVGGDIAYCDGVKWKKWITCLELWNANMATTENLMIPMVTAIGNHEVAGGYGKTREDAPLYFALFDGLFAKSSHAALDFGDYLSIILLDSGHTAPVSGPQSDWLSLALEERAGRPHIFVAYHIPAFPSVHSFEDPLSAEIRKRWCPLFQKHHVSAVFEHHEHAYKRTHLLENGRPAKNGILYVGDGAWGRDPGEVTNPKKRPYLAKWASSCNVIRVTLDGTSRAYHVVDPAGKVLDEWTVTKPE